MSLTRERTSPGHCRESRASVLTREDVVEAEAEARLRRSSYGEIRCVTCEFHEGVLTLRGHVPTFYLKQVAQSLFFAMERVEEINNRVEVASHSRHAWTERRRCGVFRCLGAFEGDFLGKERT